MLDTKTVNEFINELGSNSPAPGGGSVAALSSSLGAALSSMVFNLTVGKKAYNAYTKEEQQKVDAALEKAEAMQQEFLELMNKDTEVFNEVMKCFKMPKETEEEKAERRAAIQDGYKKAAQVPFEVAKKSFEVYELIQVACELGNKNAISDAGVSALMIQAGIEGAILNVRINTGSIKDEVFTNELNTECDELITKGRVLRDKILEEVHNKL